MNLARFLAEWRDRGRLLLKPDALFHIHLNRVWQAVVESLDSDHLRV
jgi:hypothetical protein